MKKINFESQLKILKENKHYRFSDLFYQWGIRWNLDRNYILKKDEYKNSILRKYLENKTKEIDYQTLKKIIIEDSNKKKSRDDTERDEAAFFLIEPWKSQMYELAKRENVSCKLSGIATEADWGSWKKDDLFPYMIAQVIGGVVGLEIYKRYQM